MTDLEGLRDRYRGALVGSAVGDALGATVEFMARDAISRKYGELREIVGGGWLNLPKGEVTDDTQMARCIARSLAERGEFDGDDIAARFVEWYRSNPPDIGNTTRDALVRLASGVPWQEAGQQTHEKMRPRDKSNGSVMRCAPVALFARADPKANARYSADSSRITHANPLCIAGCVALNAGIAALLNGPGTDSVSVAINATDDDTVRESLGSVHAQTAETLDAGGYVLATLQSSFWALTTNDTLEEAIVAAVNLGQDADTTGAVAGALAGARWGYSAIPDRWRDVLRGREELVELADRLLELSFRDA
ncbi:MAG TPA: ADP-ribosylglycohydrolase family protein [Thermomicrobiales bacterium]|nr:ADP-ribosylglycohydrolase family protein [Thermomicrobiales bacterium]